MAKTRKYQRKRRGTRRRRHRGGSLPIPPAAIVLARQDPNSPGTLMTLGDALEFKDDEPIRF